MVLISKRFWTSIKSDVLYARDIIINISERGFGIECRRVD